MTTRYRLLSLLAAGLTFTALPGLAQQRGDCGVAGSWNVFQEYENNPTHQKKIHDALKLTGDQEAAWKKYIDAVQQPKAGARSSTDWGTLTAPERVEQLVDSAKRNEEHMAKQADAMKAFYGVLTPEQKKTFDQFHGGPRKGA